MSEPKNDESFKVVDRRLFNAEGELRKEIAEQQDREHSAATLAAAVSRWPAKTPVVRSLCTRAAAPTPELRVMTIQPERNTAAGTLNVDAPRAVPGIRESEGFARSAKTRPCSWGDMRTRAQVSRAVLDLEGAQEMIDMMDCSARKDARKSGSRRRRADY